MKKATIEKLVETVDANYKEKVTVWGNENETFIECKGFTGPSKKVEKIIADLGLKITSQRRSHGSSYSGYYYWVEE